MLADGHYVDGSWLLTICIDELDIEKQVRVQGDWSVGEVLSQLTQDLPPPPPRLNKPNDVSLRSGTLRTGWGEHCLWWPAKCRWLIHKILSLNQYGLQADAILHFLPIYGQLRVQLPDLQTRNFVEVNYTDPVFRVTMSICRHLNIRHPEELSLAFPLTTSDMKPSRIIGGVTDRRYHTLDTMGKRSPFQRSATLCTTHTHTREAAVKIAPTLTNGGNDTEAMKQNGVIRRTSTISEHLFGPPRIRDKYASVRVPSTWNQSYKQSSPGLSNSTFYPGSISTLAFEYRSFEDPTLSCSPTIGVEEASAKAYLLPVSNFMHRTRLNANWLDSSRSLMEQGLHVLLKTPDELDNVKSRMDSPVKTQQNEVPLLLLRFKYGTYYDLNQKYDVVRINQLYEQAKWSVISQQVEATEDEVCLLAALQAQVEISSEHEEKEALSTASLSQFDGQESSISDLKKAIRDISPIGGYLRHQQAPRLVHERPLSVVELNTQIDAMLDELSTIDGADLLGVGGYHQSRSRKRRTPRPLSLIDPSISEPVSDPGLPQLKCYVKVCKPRKFGLKVFRRVYMVVDGLKLMVYKNEQDYLAKGEPTEVVCLPGCEVQPDLCMTSERYSIRMFVPVSRTNLPLSAAFNLGTIVDNNKEEDELGLKGRLKRRASLLSLTSLSHFGIQSSGNSSGCLTGAPALVLGFMNEVFLRFPNPDAYTDWLAFLRLATAVPNLTVPSEEDETDLKTLLPPAEWASIVNRSTYDSERKAISSLIALISLPKSKGDKVDGIVQITGLHERLEHRFVDFVPMKIGGIKQMTRTIDYRAKDQTDTATSKVASLPVGTKPPQTSTMTALPCAQRSSICRRISLAYTRVHHLTSLQAKLKYISAWEQMANHGIAFFPARIEVTMPMSSLLQPDPGQEVSPKSGVPWLNRPLGSGNVTVSSSRRVEAVGIGPTRVFRCDLQTGELIASWRLSTIHGWHINWELGELLLLIFTPPSRSKDTKRNSSPVPAATEPAGRVIIRPLGVPVRVVAEFLGGYTFLSLRSPEKNQGLDEGVFYKLTTGYSFPMAHSNVFH